MVVKREAAFHEAGHAVVAFLSRFHAIVGGINLSNYGAGEIYVSLSKSKLKDCGMSTDMSIQYNNEVVQDLAVVLSAGLAAERIAENREADIFPNLSCAEPDYELMMQQLAKAQLPKELEPYEQRAHKVLTENWQVVSDLANFLLQKKSVNELDLNNFVQHALSNSGV